MRLYAPRNLYERVEVLVPVRDEFLRERIHREMLDAYLSDSRKARILLRDGTYIRAWQPARGARTRKPPANAFSAQDFLISVAEGRQLADFTPPPPSPAGRRKVLAGRVR